MFGALMGTLSSFQKQTFARSKQVERRAEIDARVKERVAREKEEIEAEKEKVERERRQKEEQLKSDLQVDTVPTLLPDPPLIYTPSFARDVYMGNVWTS